MRGERNWEDGVVAVLHGVASVPGLPQSSAAKFSGSNKRPACARPHGRRAAQQSQKGKTMVAIYVIVILVIAALILSAMSVRIIKQYERVVVFELGR